MDNLFYKMAIKRRSIYHLNNQEILSEPKVMSLIEEMLKHCPTAFNSQSGRLVVLFGDNHHKLWNIVLENLRKIVPENAFAKTEERINSFAKGFGTVLYFIDENVTRDLQASYPLYKNNFPVWDEQASGMLQYMIWAALAEEEIGASLQHYNEIIAEDVYKIWNLPQNWRLVAQMPMGGIAAPADEKTYLPTEMRLKVFK